MITRGCSATVSSWYDVLVLLFVIFVGLGTGHQLLDGQGKLARSSAISGT